MMDSTKRAISLTVDYEIFGDGTGDVREHMLAPTESMARICEKFHVPLTVYFEVEEYLAFEREREALKKRFGYDPAAEIRDQIVKLARRGHDIQLHLHPEWVGCRLINGEWQLRPEQRTVDSLFATQQETTRFIGERKAVIDELLREAGRPQRVTAYRAGAFCAQPGEKLLRALSHHGFVLDSSVVKGMHRRDEHVAYDFSTAPAEKRHWPVSDNVAIEDGSGAIVEVPIYSRMGRRYHQITPKRITAKFSKHVPKSKQRESLEKMKVSRNPLTFARFLLERFPTKLDFHNMTSGQMLRWIRNAPAAPARDLDVLILIGHSKEHRDDQDFERFLDGVSRDPALQVISLTELSQALLTRNGNERIHAGGRHVSNQS